MKLLKNKQNRLLSKIWRTKLEAREIEKNNYHLTGDVRKAREFARMIVGYHPEVNNEKRTEPVVIYSA